MNPRLCAAILLAMVTPATLAASSVEKIRNEKVVVTEDTLAPGESELLGQHPAMVVFMNDGKAFTTTGRSSVHRVVQPGQTAMESEEPRSIKNAGSAPLHFARIQFLTQGDIETWGPTGLAPNYKVLHEDQYSRAYDIRIPPHEFEPRHTHHARIVVSLSGATLEHILPDGTHQPSTLKTGEIAFRPAATHIGHNLGDTPLWVIAVEPK